jgi:hypothetical protein
MVATSMRPAAAADYEQVEVRSRAAWRTWLAANHGTSRGVRVITFKKHAGRHHLAYAEVAEEAL